MYTEMVSNSKDFLTKLYTRQVMTEQLERMEERNEVFSLVLFDLDEFKEINDTYGHREGDRILVHFSRLLRETLNKDAIIGRIGGDEFLVILKTIDRKEIDKFVIDLAYNTNKFNQEHAKIRIQYSHGISFREKDSSLTTDELFVKCDILMYKEKATHKIKK